MAGVDKRVGDQSWVGEDRVGVGGWESLPCSGALLRGLAEEEAELLQALGKDVFAGHGGLRGKWDEGEGSSQYQTEQE